MFHLTNKQAVQGDSHSHVTVSCQQNIDFNQVLAWIGSNFSFTQQPNLLCQQLGTLKFEIKAVNIKD